MKRCFGNCHSGSIKLFESDEDGEHGVVTLVFLIDFNAKDVTFWRKFTYKVSPITNGSVELHLGNYPLDKFGETCEQLLKELYDDKVRCSFCGKVIELSESHWHAPTACACDDCEAKAIANEKEFMSMLD